MLSNMRLFEQIQHIQAPREIVFDFFSDATNLSRITPGWLGFEILNKEPVQMAVGALIDYRLRLHGIPIRWRTEITVWEPPYRFVDRQIKGPYRQWIHEHRFSQLNGGVTKMEDQVEYSLPGGYLEPLIHRFFVRRDIERIFAYRREVIENIFA